MGFGFVVVLVWFVVVLGGLCVSSCFRFVSYSGTESTQMFHTLTKKKRKREFQRITWKEEGEKSRVVHERPPKDDEPLI